MEIITADGGFDFSEDFNKQEINITQLLFAQIAYAIIMQKRNGVFILKIFETSIDLSIMVFSDVKGEHFAPIEKLLIYDCPYLVIANMLTFLLPVIINTL